VTPLSAIFFPTARGLIVRLELIGTELGMFRDLEPGNAPILEDLSTEDRQWRVEGIA
jgi:hypothetical protein